MHGKLFSVFSERPCFTSYGMRGNECVVVAEWRAVLGGQGSVMTGDKVRIVSGRRAAEGASLARLKVSANIGR